MDPSSLSALGTVGLGYTVKFLFDRANAALDRRAQRHAAIAPESRGSSTEGAGAGTAGESPAATLNQDPRICKTINEDAANKEAAENEVIGAMRVLEIYRAKNLALEPGDPVLLDTVQRLHSALERLEGAPVDLNAAVKSLIEVDQSADHVHGMLTGADLGVSIPDGTATHVRQEIGTVHEGGSVTGFRMGGVE